MADSLAATPSKPRDNAVSAALGIGREQYSAVEVTPVDSAVYLARGGLRQPRVGAYTRGPMRRRSLLPTLLLAAGAWLAAGPGGITVQVIAACRHHMSAHASHHPPQVPTGTPCFCGEMQGGADVLLTPAVPAPPLAAAVVLGAPRLVPLPRSSLPLSSVTRAPVPPPPLRIA